MKEQTALISNNMLSKASDDTMPQFPDTEEQAQALVAKKTICLSLTLKKMGVRRKVSSSTDAIETDVDRSLLTLGKTIIDSPELEAIITLDAKVRAEVKKKALTVEMPLRGCYLLPTSVVSVLDERLVEYKAEREMLVEAYCLAYPTRIAQAEQRLGKLFNQSDYLDAALVKDAFRMEWTYPEPVKVSSNLKEISNHIFNREIGKMADRCQEMLQQVDVGLIQYMDEFITKMIDSLNMKDDGKPKTFKSATVQNFVDFLAQLPQMNITNNDKLAELGRKAKEIMEGADPKILRKDMSVREALQDKLKGLKTVDLAPLIENKPTRKFSFED